MLWDMKFKFALKIALPILLVLVAGTLFFLYYNNRIPENALVYYRIKDHKGEISVWRASNCEMNGDEFHCHAKLCPDDKLRGYPLSQKYRPDTNTYQDTAYINLNFGLFKKTSYIPRPIYAEFDTAYFKKQFDSVKETFPCSHSKTFSSPYELTAIDLPSGVFFYETGKKKNSPKTAKSKTKNERKDSLNSNLKTEPAKLSILCPDFGGRAIPHYTCYCDNYPTYCGNPKYTNMPALPERHFYAMDVLSLKDSSFTWKLIYKTPYSEADTLEVT
ncbi:hypothetical protein IKQ19_20035, partial [Candidatus Saccharibacteria bacterium]|nr:hypothetical protein [Candidatus Saccharibacteria bacterium]